MNFQNSYILIFKKNISPKIYSKLFIYLIFILIILSIILKNLDFSMNSNDLIKKYQLEKIENTDLKQIETIIVGDSSAGNSINAKLFSELSNEKTLNLSLTGSWGILGSLGIIKKVYKENPDIRNIIVIQTLDIWNRPYSKNSLHELFSLEERIKLLGIKSVISNEINVKELNWHYNYLIKKIKNKKMAQIDLSLDYLKQKDKKEFISFNAIKKINDDKLDEYEMLDNYCSSKKLNCIYLNGPIHEGTANASSDFLQNYKLRLNSNYIKYVDKILTFPDLYMGDTEDHIRPEFKDNVTKTYYNVIKPYLK